MTDASTTPQVTDLDADASDATELPEHHEHAIMARRLDEDAV